HWMVLVKQPSPKPTTNSQIIDYYVGILGRISGSEQDSRKRLYHASCDTFLFGFCCEIDEETASALPSVEGVLSVKPDPDVESAQKDYSHPSSSYGKNALLFPLGTNKRWMVRMERPAVGAIRKARVVDYYVQVLMKVLRNEQDAQMCIYHVSWQSNYGFCCELDEECAEELAAVPGVLSVEPDDNIESGSDTKDYGGFSGSSPSSDIKTKKLFITGLSFYTSEKTLRAAFESFGEIIEVKIIMDKISKRSKGYGFVEYTTEDSASTALREMNGKIINGWMITVDVARQSPPRYTRKQPQTT
ncbi:hypothetical protein M569_11514, partial [Genlisea aurea]